MVNDEDMKKINTLFNQSYFKTKREFYRDMILKDKIVNLDISGHFSNEIRQLSALASKNSNNINQITRRLNMNEEINKDALLYLIQSVDMEMKLLFSLRKKINEYVINGIF